MSLTEKIAHLCEQKGISRNKFEIESGVGRGQSARWDKNKPSAEKLQMTADYFNVSVDFLLNDEIEKPAPDDEDELAQLKAEVLKELEGASPAEIAGAAAFLRTLKQHRLESDQ